MPNSVAGLCSVVREGVWEQLLEFYGAKQQPPLRIFVQSADPPGQAMLQGPCEKLFVKEFKKRAANDNPYAIKFAAELLIPSTLRKTRYAAISAAAADFVLLEVCIIGRGQQGQYVQDVAERLISDPGASGMCAGCLLPRGQYRDAWAANLTCAVCRCYDAPPGLILGHTATSCARAARRMAATRR